MNGSFLYNTSSLTICIVLIISMALFYYLGLYAKAKKLAKNQDREHEGFGPVEGSLLGLLALLLSFTFSMSSSRHDSRFQAMVQEANTIGTAILRADLFPDSERTVMRSYFNKYVDARIALYTAGTNPEKNQMAIAETGVNSAALWKMAISAANSSDITERNRGSMMVVSLNDMIDAITTRKASRDTTMPDSILYLLFMLCLSSAFIVGYGTKQKPDIIVAVVFAIMTGITIFTILDLDRPHRGLITLDKAEQNILDLKGMLK